MHFDGHSKGRCETAGNGKRHANRVMDSSPAAMEMPAGPRADVPCNLRALGRDGVKAEYVAGRADAGFDEQVAIGLLHATVMLPPEWDMARKLH